MPKACAAEIHLTNQIDQVLRRNRAVQRRSADRSPEMQRASNVLCDRLDALVGSEWLPQNASK